MGEGGFFDLHQQLRPRRRIAAGAGANPAGAGANQTQRAEPLTVLQLTRQIKSALEKTFCDPLSVRGQVSNFRPHQASGHYYFTLKDASACIPCVMWQSDAARLKFKPVEGMELLAHGKVTVYEQGGRYQLCVTSLRPLGQGALELAFQQMRARLEAEGLFNAERKKPLPGLPMTIALVTGRDTAALADVLKVLRRYPWLRLLLYPVPVQGESAAPRIAAALTHLSRSGHQQQIDVILLVRGGGSLEDLWAFNEEAVARAIAASAAPIITGIGHEVDTSIADLVADHHAHTPTEAAQVVVRQWQSVRDDLEQTTTRLRRALLALLHELRNRLRAIERHETFRRPLDRTRSLRQFLDDRQRAMTLAMTRRLSDGEREVQGLSRQLALRLPRALRGLGDRVQAISGALSGAMLRRLRTEAARVAVFSTRAAELHPRGRLLLNGQKLHDLTERLARTARADLALRRQALAALERNLQAVGPQNVLRRGYTLTTRKKDRALITDPAQVRPGERLLTRFADGEVESVVEDARQPRLFD